MMATHHEDEAVVLLRKIHSALQTWKLTMMYIAVVLTLWLGLRIAGLL